MRNVPPGIQTMSPVRRSSDGRSFRSMSVRGNVMAPAPDVGALLAVIPETLRARWVRVVPAHAGSGSSACPSSGRSGGYKSDGSAGSDGSAPGPIVPTRPCPTYAAAGKSRTHYGTTAYHGTARDAATRADNCGPAHGAATSHGDASTSRADLDDRAFLLELLLERTTGSGNESRRRRSRDRQTSQTSQTNDGRTGHAVESLRCAATLTNESHHCRLHFQPFHVCPPRH